MRIVLGQRAVDLALPGEVPLVELMPSVLLQLAPEAADQGTEHDGWVVQRLGGPPLDEDRTLIELNLLDGETVFLLPRADQMPPIDFDDLVDGVGEQASRQAGLWTDDRSRIMLVTFGGLLLTAGLLMLGLDASPTARAIVAATLAALLVVAAGLVSRAVPDPQIGTMFAGFGAAYAATAGWSGAAALAPDGGLSVRISLAVFAALAALTTGATAVADAGLLFATAFAFVGNLALPALLATASTITPQQAAAAGLLATLVVALVLPPAAFRLGGLALPLLPGKPEQLSEDIEPTGHLVVVERGAAGVAYFAALTIGLGAAQALLGVALVIPGGWWSMIFAATAAALMFMRARHLSGAVSRWATMAPAVVLVLASLVRFAVDQPGLVRAGVLVPAVTIIAGSLVAAALTLPGRRLRPYWGRAVDILELLTAVALVPAFGAVLGAYQIIRAWAS
ncbi:type VII secretion integral membrane protein EccD [Micromonospora chokoriensis]